MDTTTIIIVGVLAALVLFLLVRRAMSQGEEESVPMTPAAPVPTGNPAVSPVDVIDQRTVALITAAAMAAVGAPIRIRRITFLNQNTVSAWAEVGRISIQSSHNVRRSL